jgi:integrase
MPRAKPKKKDGKTVWTAGKAGAHLTVEEHGVAVTLRERGGVIWREVRVNGRRQRQSLKHGDRDLAETQAKALAANIAELRLTGGPTDGMTLGPLLRLYAHHRAPLLSESWRKLGETRTKLFIEAWGDSKQVQDINQSDVDRYSAARRAGTLTPFVPAGSKGRKGRAPVPVKDGTLHGDFNWLSSVFNWARGHKVNGRRLLSENPLHDVNWPRERNVRRPVASHQRYTRTQEHTDAVDGDGRLRCILSLARFTGRRVDAICNLMRSDILLTEEQVSARLAALGRDERVAEHMPRGAIHWRAVHDKQGFDEVAPLGSQARQALDDYLRKFSGIGAVPLFPAPGRPAAKSENKPVDTKAAEPAAIDKRLITRWLLKAEAAAGLPKLDQGTFHPYRRLWATERKGYADADVAAAGGWRDTRALKMSYQQSDPASVLRVVEAG